MKEVRSAKHQKMPKIGKSNALLFLVDPLVTLFQNGESCFFSITDRERLGYLGCIDPTNHFLDRIFTKRANFQWSSVYWSAQLKTSGTYAARLLLIISIYRNVFVERHIQLKATKGK